MAVLPVLPDALVSRIVPKPERYDPKDIPPPLGPRTTPIRLFIGPSNMAGQGWAWARSATRYLTGVGAASMAGPKKGRIFSFPVDVRVPYFVYRWSPSWRAQHIRALTRDFTHVLVESGRPLFGDAMDRDLLGDLRILRAHDIPVALVFHGSDIRLPSRHAAGSAFSPFLPGVTEMTPSLEATVQATHARIANLGLPLFVSTPDLLVDLPEATWLPVVVDPEVWHTDIAPFSGGGVPIVAHAPSHGVLKGSDLIDPILTRLDVEGILHYRRVEGLPSSEMPAVYRSADIVIDQIRMGIYGVAACEAMAAGRVVVSHVSAQGRETVANMTGLTLPIVEANPDQLESTLRRIIANPSEYLERAEAGVRFVEAVHNGRVSARVLGSFLGAHPPME